MELTLKRLLENAEFKKYRGKGYDPEDVDDFLDRAAAMASKVEVQLTQALEAAKANGAPDPSQLEAEIDRRVAERLAEQPAPAAASGPSEEETAEEVRRTIILAQRTADAAVREAREDADKILSSANEQAQTLVADAEARARTLATESEERAAALRSEVEAEASRERREARQRLAAEIAELEGVRESLRSDVNVLERHVEEQRTQLGSTLAELQQILDDPSGFRLAPPPALAEPEIPDFSDVREPAESPSDAPAAADAPEPEVVLAASAPIAEPAPAEPAASPPSAEPAQAPPAAAPAPVEQTAEAAPSEVPAAPIDEAEADGGPPAVAAPVEGAAVEEAPAPAPAALEFDEVDHEAPGVPDADDGGPPTAPVSAVDLGIGEPAAKKAGAEEDPFLAELRKAMADEEPLGPRDDELSSGTGSLFDDDDRRSWRFGRRR